MKLSNAMEHVVRSHLNQLRSESPAGDETCWCPLCRADMMALALTTLTPRYATRRPGDHELDAQTAGAVEAGVTAARRKIGRFPKHARGASVPTDEHVWVVNFPLEEGFRAVEGILRRHDGVCDCWHCRCDVVAFALNRYPARYGVEHGGLTHLFDEDRARMRDELSVFLDLAVRVVMTVPRHEFDAVVV